MKYLKLFEDFNIRNLFRKILDFIKTKYKEEFIKLSVGYTNKIAINMYKNFGFKEADQNNKYEFFMIKENK